MIDLFNFDLQLFNDVQPNKDTSVEDVDIGEITDFDFAIDENGDVIFKDDDIHDEHVEVPKSYTVKVNGEEIDVPLNELLAGYQRTADYTRKTQEVAAMRQQYEAQLAQFQQAQAQQQVQQPVQQQQQPAIDPKEYYARLAEYAKGRVENIFGNYDELDPMHQAALADEIANVKVQVVQKQQAEMALNSVMNRYASDPEWQNIDRYALERLNNLPYAQAVQVKARIDAGDAGFIDNYLSAIRNEYYEVKNGQVNQANKIVQGQQASKPKPPFVESGGSSENNPAPSRNIDYKALGKMSVDQQVQVFQKLGLSNL